MVQLEGRSLTIEQVAQVARKGARVAPLDKAARARMEASQKWVERAIYEVGTIIYGVNTGFGPLAQKRIAPEEARKLSRNLILGCAAGVGAPLAKEVVRAMMLIRANTFVQGHSGGRPVLAETLIEMLNRGVTPYVPEKGSLGASGDLAPLAHIAVVLTRDSEGEGGYSGQAWLGEELMSGAEAMARVGLERLVPEAKEGLALTNGTNMMVAVGALGVYDGESLLRQAEIAAALSYEALLGLSEALHPALHEANGQPGQAETAARLLRLLEGSRLIDSRPERVQDPYSLRCTPQVLGPVRDALAFLRERFTAALNAASDNPLVFMEHEPALKVSGGNFHGQGPSMWLDFLKVAMAQIGGISERRVFRMLTPELSEGLPAMLVRTSGLDSGLMIPQYTAAALVSDNKALAHPDSVDSIPSSANQEDHVSMGANAARRAREVIENVQHILAIELLTAAQAIDLREEGPARLGRGTAAAYRVVRRHVSFLEHDREFTPDIELLAAVVTGGELDA